MGVSTEGGERPLTFRPKADAPQPTQLSRADRRRRFFKAAAGQHRPPEGMPVRYRWWKGDDPLGQGSQNVVEGRAEASIRCKSERPRLSSGPLEDLAKGQRS